jgi:hypothetical protein
LISFNAHICALKYALRSGCPNLFRGCVSSLGIDIGRNDLGPLLCKQQCDAFSNSHRGAGYERYAAFETHTSPLLPSG